jgi:hypothetical protein
LLPVENPKYLFVRESAATMEENYKYFHQEEGIIVVEAIIDSLQGGTRFPSLLVVWRRTQHRRGGMTLFSSMA